MLPLVPGAVSPVPPLPTGRVPVTCEVRSTPDKVPPKVKLPVVVTVPERVIPLTVPVPPTEVTVPEPGKSPNSRSVSPELTIAA